VSDPYRFRSRRTTVKNVLAPGSKLRKNHQIKFFR